MDKSDSAYTEGDVLDSDGCVDCESDTDAAETASAKKAGSSRGKLWTKAQFPEGTDGHQNWDLANLQAAQEWACPCPDRHNCIGKDRMTTNHLYDHRKHFRTRVVKSNGGLRDANRSDMQGHYAKGSRSFTRSFVVGPCGDCCAASAGLAKGLSFATWAASRADVTKNRPWHAGRTEQRADQESRERAHLQAYVRDLRASLEGPKGGSEVNDKWHIAYMSVPKRWQEYKKMRTKASLPVIGSEPLSKKIWAKHDEIHQFTATGHSCCDICGRLLARRAQWQGRTDAVGTAENAKLDAEEVRLQP